MLKIEITSPVCLLQYKYLWCVSIYYKNIYFYYTEIGSQLISSGPQSVTSVFIFSIFKFLYLTISFSLCTVVYI